MTSDWTLKDKSQLWEDMCTNVYAEGIVNHLRLELINDIDVIDCTDKSKLKKWEIIEEVLSIIDKRFGVDI